MARIDLPRGGYNASGACQPGAELDPQFVIPQGFCNQPGSAGTDWYVEYYCSNPGDSNDMFQKELCNVGSLVEQIYPWGQTQCNKPGSVGDLYFKEYSCLQPGQGYPLL